MWALSSNLLSDYIDGDGRGFRRHALLLVAGLIAELCLDEMIAGCGGDLGLDGEVACVDVQLGLGICWEGEFGSLRVACGVELNAGVGGDDERSGDEELILRRVRVDVQARRDAEMERDGGGLACGDGNLFGVEVLDGLLLDDGVIGLVEQRRLAC